MVIQTPETKALLSPEDIALLESSEKYIAKMECYVQECRAMGIKDQNSYDVIVNEVKMVKCVMSDMDKCRKERVAPFNLKLEVINGSFRGPYKLLMEAEKIFKDGIIAWDALQLRKQQEEQRKINEAHEKAEAEKRKKLQEEADAFRARGNEEMAKTVEFMSTVETPPPVAPQTYRPQAGVVQKKSWKAEVTDLMTLVKAVAEGKTSLLYLQGNQDYLNKVAVGSAGAEKIPGVKFFEVTTSAISKGK